MRNYTAAPPGAGTSPDVETIGEAPQAPIGAVPFGKACDRKGGRNCLPFSRAKGYKEVKAKRLKTFLVGRFRYISLIAIAEYISEREAETAIEDERRSDLDAFVERRTVNRA